MADLKTATAVGLLAGEEPIPLEGVRVEATIQDFCSKITMTQRYANRESHPVEAVYVFPVDETAAVCGFAAWVDGVEIVGEVQERDEAFDTYDDAMARGHGAYLLDQERPDVFTASIGNLPPGKEVLVKLTYVTELIREGDSLQFTLPTTVSPRYAPAEDRKGVGRPPAEAVNPPVAWDVPYGLELTMSIEMGTPIRSLESPTHPIAIELDGARASVRLGERRTALDRDFVLMVRLAEPELPRAWVEDTPDGETVAMVTFQPHLDVSEAPCEVIFLVDRSGSMRGKSIQEAQNALQLSLRSLSENTRFNIVGFGSRHHSLFPESVPYAESTLAEASKYVRTLEANLGGTDIYPALESVLRAPSHPELPRQLFVLTDGQVTNTEAVIALVRKHSDTTRVFTFGIGAGASHHLVRGVARAGEGSAEFIAPGERIEAKVLRQLRRALTPALTGVQIDWGGLRVRQAPHRIPPAFADGRVLVYGFIEEPPPSGEAEITLRATGPDGNVSFVLPLTFTKERSGTVIATLAARTLLRDLEEGASAFHERGSLRQRHANDRVKDEAVRIGKAYGLASRWTSFVAVEARDTPVEGRVELRRIPVALTRGWGGLELSTGRTMAGPSFSLPASALPLGRVKGKSLNWGGVRRQRARTRPLDSLVGLQRADGSWDLNEAFANAIGETLAELESSIPPYDGDRDDAEKAWATALALHWLEDGQMEWRDEWQLVAEKARRWLDRCHAQPAGNVDWCTAAIKIRSR